MDSISCSWSSKALTYGTQVITYPKVAWIYTPEFTFGTNLEQIAPGKLMTFVHITIRRFTPSVWKHLKHLWLSRRHLLPPIVYASGDVCDAKWATFVERLGFQPLLQDCPCSDGQNRPIYIHMRH